MDSKEYLTNKKFCPIPWTGFMYNSNGDVLNCIRSQLPIGNLKDNSIHDILKDNTETKKNMQKHIDGIGCRVCYDLEGDNKGYDIISDRIFYLKELKSVVNEISAYFGEIPINNDQRNRVLDKKIFDAKNKKG